MNNSSGYVKLYRAALDDGQLKNHKLWAFWCWCLMKASHQEREQVVGYQRVKLMPGQFIFGRKAAAIELGMSEKSIRVSQKALIRANKVAVKGTNKFSIITLVNWESEQGKEEEKGQQKGQQGECKRANKGPQTSIKALKNKDSSEQQKARSEQEPACRFVIVENPGVKSEAELVAEYRKDPLKAWNGFLIVHYERYGHLPTWRMGEGHVREFKALDDALHKVESVGGDKARLLEIYRLFLADNDDLLVKNGHRPSLILKRLDGYLARSGKVYVSDSRIEENGAEKCLQAS